MAKDNEGSASGPLLKDSTAFKQFLDRLKAKDEAGKSLEQGAQPPQAGGLSFPLPEVLIISATEGEHEHILGDRLAGIKREPSPLTSLKKDSAEHLTLECGNKPIQAMLVNLAGKGEVRACAVLQRILWDLNLTYLQLEKSGGGNQDKRLGLPKLIVNIGISMTTHKDVRLGDVVIAESLVRYLEDTRVQDKKDVDGNPVSMNFIPRYAHEPDIQGTLVNRIIKELGKSQSSLQDDWKNCCIRTISVVDLIGDATGNWKVPKLRLELEVTEDCLAQHKAQEQTAKPSIAKQKELEKKDAAARKKLTDAKATENAKFYRDLVHAKVVTRLVGLKPHHGAIMSGPFLGDSSVLKKHLVEQGLGNCLALDMESGGVAWAWQEIPTELKPKLLILRAISDYGDGSKKDTDGLVSADTAGSEAASKVKDLLKQVEPDAFRKIAMLRAWDLMICLLGTGIHEPE